MPIIVCTAICSCIFIHLLPTHIRSLCNICTQERKCLRWMDVLGNKFTWKTRHRVFVSCVAAWLWAARNRQANMASLWLPCHGLQGWNMFLISVKLPAANSIMWLFSRCLSFLFFVSLRNPLFFLSPYPNFFLFQYVFFPNIMSTIYHNWNWFFLIVTRSYCIP